MWLSTSTGRIVMTKSGMYRQFGPDTFANFERKIAANQYVGPDDLARVLRANAGAPIPPEIHDYLCDFLQRKIRAPTGRRADIEKPLPLIKKHLIPPTYARYLAWLKRRKRSMGLKGWKTIREADWWEGPLNERAARMTCRRLRPAMDWRRVQNIVSEANK